MDHEDWATETVSPELPRTCSQWKVAETETECEADEEDQDEISGFGSLNAVGTRPLPYET